MSDRAILVLGMHRSGTSCLARMLAAGGLASAGEAVRNWDNARGHFEMLDAVRLNEAVLAHSGGHWLSPPTDVRWTDEHAAARDRLLAARIVDRSAERSVDRPALIKDPRTLLTLPFWRASRVPFHAVAIVRHPLAVARSLESWRGTPIAEGIALWTAHNEALLADRATHDFALIDFDAPREVMIVAALSAARAFASDIDEVAFASAYEDQLVHHDGAALDADDVAGAPASEPAIRHIVGDAYALYARLVDTATTHTSDTHDPRAAIAGGKIARRGSYPRAAMTAFARRLDARDLAAAITSARDALATAVDASADLAAVLVPIVTGLVRHRAFDAARAFIDEHAAHLEHGMADLLRAKVLLGANDASGAVAHLEAAIAVENPYHQARHLLPEALRRAGRPADARVALERIVGDTLYPHGPLSTLAEWSWLDGDHARAIDEMARAIESAPPNRRGRLRTRRAEWLLARGDAASARAEIERAIVEDPAYTRSRDVKARLPRDES